MAKNLIDDGQPKSNDYIPSVMNDIDVIANILDKFRNSGITYKFQANTLIITAVTYAYDTKKIMEDLTRTINDVLKYLKDEYKTKVGKALTLKDEEKDLQCVSNYTVDKKCLCTLVCSYTLPESKAEKGPKQSNLIGKAGFISNISILKENQKALKKMRKKK